MSQISYRPETADDAPLIEALLERAFGPGRHAKAADRLRENNRLIPELSFTAWDGDRLAGSVRMWPVTIAGEPVVFLGPIAVEAELRKHKIGQQLVELACEASARVGWRAVLLVGDAPYFGRVGFEAEPARGVVMPGPVDQRRVLLKPLRDGGADGLAGPVWR
ncbi:GNAT family N-acetyltransferase [Caulobacter mirabilis]|uniref:GNAT family N-acetyltransferase n=1 Tax=Caulobacter mirabilis TaxID=69666 RepID=A0A2D2AUT8_9CAUL|nr:N-acetyltransferase [Caulobacter mirabilis]ATQ41770.1 GNAT family N-acetyltransferase [Caulobacter mirabilis]